MEARKSFMGPGASTSHYHISIVSWKEKPNDTTATQDLDCTVLKSFMKTCMKLLRDQEAIQGLQGLIDNCAIKDKSLP